MKTAMRLIATVALIGSASAGEITTTASDGTIVYGETYYDNLPTSAPVISMFHQARSNGRGEYAPLTGWLNGLGYRVIAWDQRSGGDLYGSENRTAAASDKGNKYCDAWPDVMAGVAYAKKVANGAPVVVWGSSYSASLVWRAAIEYDVDALVAFSTATGFSLDSCGAKAALPKLATAAHNPPFLAVWPKRETDRAHNLAPLLKAVHARTYIVKHGVHGSSALVDDRTHHDMSGDRAFVAQWLATALKRDGAKGE